MAYAQGKILRQGTDIDINNDVIGCCSDSGNYEWEKTEDCEVAVDNANCNQLRLQLQVNGLENAIIKVKNQETAQHLEQVMNRILEHRKLILQKLQNLTITEQDGDIIAEGKTDAKLLGIFKLKHSYKYNLAEDGQLTRIKKWHEFLWKDTGDME